jgi:hypothetical protein
MPLPFFNLKETIQLCDSLSTKQWEGSYDLQNARERSKKMPPKQINILTSKKHKLPSKIGKSVSVEMPSGAKITMIRDSAEKVRFTGFDQNNKVVPVRQMTIYDAQDDQGYCLFCIDDPNGVPYCMQMECPGDPPSKPKGGKPKGAGPGKKPLPKYLPKGGATRY